MPVQFTSQSFKRPYFSFSGLLSWDETSCHVDLGRELEIITSVAPPGEECRGGMYIFTWYLGDLHLIYTNSLVNATFGSGKKSY